MSSAVRPLPAILSREEVVSPPIATLIATLRGHNVILDADLAALYGVPTKALNQAVKRNRERFPDDFLFQLDREEVTNMRSQIVTAYAQSYSTQAVTKSHRNIRHATYAVSPTSATGAIERSKSLIHSASIPKVGTTRLWRPRRRLLAAAGRAASV